MQDTRQNLRILENEKDRLEHALIMLRRKSACFFAIGLLTPLVLLTIPFWPEEIVGKSFKADEFYGGMVITLMVGIILQLQITKSILFRIVLVVVWLCFLVSILSVLF